MHVSQLKLWKEPDEDNNTECKKTKTKLAGYVFRLDHKTTTYNVLGGGVLFKKSKVGRTFW